MKTSTRANFRSLLLRVLVLALIAFGFSATPSVTQAATVSPFTALYSKNINGQVVVTGNTNMSCPTSNDALGAKIPDSEVTACQDARIRTIRSGLNLNNNAYRMIYTGVGNYGNKSMINSSTAQVAIPEGSTIKSAFLFWHGDMSKPSNADGGKSYNAGVAKGCESDTTFCRDKVWLVTPQSAAAHLVNADSMSSENPTSGIYRAHADITQNLTQIADVKWTRANGKKIVTIRVGDIESAQGRDTQAGWSIIVAYAHPDEALRNVVIYGGLAKVAQKDPVNVELSGFQTPPSGSVATSFGFVAAEGDASESGDFLKLISGSSTNTIGDAVNPINNPANSTISQNGGLQNYFDNTSGKYTNTFGTDADQFKLVDAIPNNATEATVQMGTNLETWYPIAFTMATELYSPEIQLTKVVKDSVDIQNGVSVGDQVEFMIYISNVSSSGSAQNVVINDRLPAGLRFVSTTSGDSNCTGSGQEFTCDLGTLAAMYPPSGTCGCVQLIAEVVAGTGTITNIATASYSGPLGELEATSNVTTLKYAKYNSDLITIIESDEPFLDEGTQNEIFIDVRNEGPATNSDYAVEIEIPSNVSVVTPLPAGCTQTSQIITCDETAGTSSDPGTKNELGAGEYVRIPITVEPEADFGSAEFSAEAISEAGSNDGDVSSVNNVDSAQFVTTEAASQETISRPGGNSAPNVSPIEVDATSGEAIEIDVTQYLRDREFDEMEIADFSQPTDDAGSVDLAGSTFTFTAEENFIGDSTFEFSVTDIRGKQVDGLIAISVYPSELPKSGGGTFFEKVKIFISSIFSK
jgi:large repetitive protein